MNPYREGKDPCRDCAERKAEAEAAKRKAKMQAAEEDNDESLLRKVESFRCVQNDRNAHLARTIEIRKANGWK